MALPRGTPNYLRKAVMASNLRFRSTAAARMPFWGKGVRVKRSPDVKKKVDEEVRSLSAKLPDSDRKSFFRAYRTLVSGKTQALETAQKIFEKHAHLIHSSDYRLHRKGFLTFEHELEASVGKSNAIRIINLLREMKIVKHRSPPVFYSVNEASAMIMANEKLVRRTIRGVLSKQVSSSLLNQEVNEAFGDIMPGLIIRCQRYDANTSSNFEAHLVSLVKNELIDIIRKQSEEKGYYRRRGSLAKVHSLDALVVKLGGENSLVDWGVSARAQGRELREELFQALDRLTPLQREVVVDYLVGGKFFHQIGKKVGLTESYVFKIYKKGIEEMRRYLSNRQ
jgi:RNA polymerase sigma factor (sigma-70 family)